MSSQYSEHFFSNKDALFTHMQSFIECTLQRSLSERARASMAVSGGTTPKALYESLSAASIEWANVDISLTDERYVPTDDADSNEAMLRLSLLKGAASKANFIPLMRTSSCAEDSAARSSEALQQLQLPMDLVILGMGNDMHTASLFPDAPELAAALSAQQSAQCLAIHPPLSAYPRLSMTLNMLLNSRAIALLITGDEKRAALELARQNNCFEKAPIAAILQQKIVPVHIFWSP